MDALSSSVSSLTLPSHYYSTSRDLFHFKTSNCISSPPIHHPHFKSCKPTAILNKPSSPFANRDFAVPFISSSQNSPLQSAVLHHKAASGYAAALVDVARCNNSLEAVAKDVHRLSKCLRNEQLRAFMFDPLTEEIEKGQVLIELAEKGRFHRNLVVILKLLVRKNTLGMVNDLLQEFKRIYDELTGTPVVLVSSATKMDKDKLFGIAKRVQKLSGALKVKVKHVFGQTLPSLATT